MNFLCQNSLKIKEDKFHHLSKDMVLHSKYFFTDLLEESIVVSLRKIVHNGQKYGKNFNLGNLVIMAFLNPRLD